MTTLRMDVNGFLQTCPIHLHLGGLTSREHAWSFREVPCSKYCWASRFVEFSSGTCYQCIRVRVCIGVHTGTRLCACVHTCVRACVHVC